MQSWVEPMALTGTINPHDGILVVVFKGLSFNPATKRALSPDHLTVTFCCLVLSRSVGTLPHLGPHLGLHPRSPGPRCGPEVPASPRPPGAPGASITVKPQVFLTSPRVRATVYITPYDKQDLKEPEKAITHAHLGPRGCNSDTVKKSA